MKKVAIFDLDGTITKEFDFLHCLSNLNGYENQSNKLMNKGIGIKYLNNRLNLLKGLNLEKNKIKILKKISYRKGIKTLIQKLKEKNYILILVTGSPSIIINFLDFKFDYVIAPKVYTKNNIIIKVEKLEENFKFKRICELIKEINVEFKDLIYFDDSNYSENIMQKVGLGFTVGQKELIKGSKYSIYDFNNVIRYI